MVTVSETRIEERKDFYVFCKQVRYLFWWKNLKNLIHLESTCWVGGESEAVVDFGDFLGSILILSILSWRLNSGQRRSRISEARSQILGLRIISDLKFSQSNIHLLNPQWETQPNNRQMRSWIKQLIWFLGMGCYFILSIFILFRMYELSRK